MSQCVPLEYGGCVVFGACIHIATLISAKGDAYESNQRQLWASTVCLQYTSSDICKCCFPPLSLSEILNPYLFNRSKLLCMREM